MIWKLTNFAPALLLTILAATHTHGADTSNPKVWTPEGMLQLKQVGGAQVSPDGKKVAFVVRRAIMDGEKSEFVSQVRVANQIGRAHV